MNLMKNTIFKTVMTVVTGATITTSAISFNSSDVRVITENIDQLKDKVIAYSENEAKLIDKYNKLYESYTKLKEHDSSSNVDIDLDIANYLQEVYISLENQIQDLNSQLIAEKTENVEQIDYIQSLENTIKELEDQIHQMESNGKSEVEPEDLEKDEYIESLEDTIKELETKVHEMESNNHSQSEIENDCLISISSNEE